MEVPHSQPPPRSNHPSPPPPPVHTASAESTAKSAQPALAKGEQDLLRYRSRTAAEIPHLDPNTYKFNPEDFNSYGKTAPFTANIMDVDALAEGFKGRSYNNELILFNGDDAPNMLEMVVSSALMFKKLGLDHWIMITGPEESCSKSRKVYSDLACIYGTPFWKSDFIQNTPNAYHDDRIARLWIFRWLVFTKAVQMGYNVLVTDLDVYWSDLFYKYVKHPHVRQFNLITPHEMMVPGINCGLVYAQDAWRDGPTAWISAQVADRTLRWREYPGFKNPQMPRYVIRLFEQDIFNDATCSAIIGRPTNARVHRYKEASKWWDVHMKYCDYTSKKARNLVFPPDYTAIDVAGDESLRRTTIEYFNITLPNTEGVYINQFGRPPFTGPRRGASLGFLEYMKAGNVPMWVEPEDADDPEGKRLSRREKFVASPHWLFDIYPAEGMLGFWGRDPPRVVGGHLIELGGHHQQSKRFLMKMLKWWDYEASKIVKGNLIWMGASRGDQFPKLVMFRPNWPIYHRTRAGMKTMVRNTLYLIYFMLRQKRAPVWPQTDCKSPWVGKSSRAVHGIAEYKLYAHGNSPNNVLCYDIGYMNAYCTSIGMMWPDFEEYVKQLNSPDETTPSARNSLSWSGSSPITEAIKDTFSFAELENRLHALQDAKIVFITKYFEVTDIPQELTKKLSKLEADCEFFMLNPVWPHT